MKRSTRRISAAAAALVLTGQLCLPAAAQGRALFPMAAEELTISQAFTDPKLIAWLQDGRNLNGAGADGVLTLAERQAVTALDLSGQGLTSLEGLEAFPNLESLDCSQNQLTQLDLSGNPALRQLSCTYNQLTSLDLSHNPLLAYVSCGYNRLTDLDLSGHRALIALNCEMNQLTALNLSGCTGLLTLYCRNNLLPELELSDNTALEFIETFSNRLTDIDVSHLANLRFLHIDHNQLTHLDLSGNRKLEGGGFVARNNRMETIVLPDQPALTVYLDDYEEQDPVEGSDRAEWFLDPDFQTPAPKTIQAQGQTLYSRRIPNQYTVYFAPNGGMGSMPSLSAQWGETFHLTANQFQRRGYTFANWSRLSGEDYRTLTDGQEVSNLAGQKTDGDRVTLYARWTPNTYTIQMDGNGADGGTMRSRSATYGVSLKLDANTYEKTGMEFAGWSLEPDGPVRYPDGAQVLNLTDGTEAVTLYAVWRQPLSEQQKPYLLQLEQAFQALASAEGDALPYTGEDWDALSQAYAQGAADIREAQTPETMETALNRGKEAMAQVPTAADRIAQVAEGWTGAHSGALAYLAGGGLTQEDAGEADRLAQQALEGATQENLAGYCPLEREEDRALVLGAASAGLQDQVEALMTLRQAAQWLAGLEAGLTQRPMSQVDAQDLEAYQSALASYDGLDGAITARLDSGLRAALAVRHELAGLKRSAAQTLQQEYGTLNLEDYSAAGKAALAQALDRGLEAIRTAASADEVQQARRDAWTAIAQVPTADREPTQPPAGGGDSGSGGGGAGGGGGGGAVPPTETPETPQPGETTQVTDEKTGASAVVTTAADGGVSAVVTLPQGVARASLRIPSAKAGPGTVAVLVEEDGTRRVLPKSVPVDGGVVVSLDRSARIELVDNTRTFSDVGAASWFAGPVGFVASRGLFSGVGEGRFAPDLPMTRAMVVTVLHTLEGNPVPGQSHTFQDVPHGAWYAQAAGWALEQGITSGVGAGSFAPDAPIAREDLALMLYRCAQSMGLAAGRASLGGFGDGEQVSAWAREAVEWACANGILSGDNLGNLNPRANTTRAEVATMLTRFVERAALA